MTSLRWAMGALLLSLVVGGCSDDAAPDVADPTVAPSTSTSVPTTAPPSTSGTPSATATPDPLTPEETVRAWVSARNVLLTSGDTDAIDVLTTSTCGTCRDLTKTIETIYKSGGYIRTKGWVVNGAKRSPEFTTNRKVSTALIFSSGVTRESAKATPIRYGMERRFLDFTVKKVDGRWLVDRVVFLA